MLKSEFARKRRLASSPKTEARFDKATAFYFREVSSLSKLKRHKRPALNPLQGFAAKVQHFGQRSLHLRDLYAACSSLDIEIVEKPMRRLHGSAYEEEGYRFVFINPLVSYAEQVIAGFHELFHIFNHVGDGEVCQSKGETSGLSKQEKQAQAAGVVALMPLCAVYEMAIEDMMREFEVSRRLAAFRLKVFNEYRR